MKRVLRTVAFLYLVVLIAALLGMHYVGENNVLTATMLFLPVQGWILPGVVLLLPCLIWDRLLAVPLAFLIAWFFAGYLQPEYNDWLPREDGDITVVSCNLGINRLEDLKPFIESETPDLISFQEVNGRRGEIARLFPEYQIGGMDQFLVLSKLPIRNEKMIETTTLHGRRPCAVRFEVDYRGRRIALYNVHMLTPRMMLHEVYKKPEILIPEEVGASDGKRRAAISAQWENRVLQIAELTQVFSREQLPMLVVGDFNMPPHGVNYPKIRGVVQDAFRVRGRRFGNTFPCDRNPPMSYFAPWSRLDYQFAGPDWRVCYFNLENGRRAQHRATAARFRLRNANPSDAPPNGQER